MVMGKLFKISCGEGFSGLSLVFQSHWSLVTFIHSVFFISFSNSVLKFNDSGKGLPWSERMVPSNFMHGNGFWTKMPSPNSGRRICSIEYLGW